MRGNFEDQSWNCLRAVRLVKALEQEDAVDGHANVIECHAQTSDVSWAGVCWRQPHSPTDQRG